ncbi:uncharacterized protein MELLADRAFT_65767 [Melampsora larici-populina 98AG31]|uniref:RRM domain-containing protein n=1 Tax=Melampsora larici-populina (strain 98AG31 / pathotype 3-4-7) TaxID=747676 RepID=F4RWM9_MELLP|nr:uncharacterized protein MELLADRAFT_65767 [Melampsora larici-populina 98AG31]EGG03061.1 hypothetical protein MELLADRAFT_65767 [Melampsora larici-populina 98AG31]
MPISQEQHQYRLHIGGIAPSVSAEEIERRFSSFGKVIAVDGIGKLDANGSVLRYGFLELETTQQQLNRCMNLLSGTTYKGHTMRIALAKPNYIERAALEKAGISIETLDENPIEELENAAIVLAAKRRRKLKKGVDGYEGENWQLMTVKRFKKHDGVFVGFYLCPLFASSTADNDSPHHIQGWKKDPATSLPIFPLIARPARPLPPLAPEKSDVEADVTVQPVSSKPLTRARRVRIDPASYRAAINGRNTHLVGPRAISIELYRLGHRAGAKDTKIKDMNRKIWECEHLDGKVIWRLKDGQDVEVEEEVQLHSYTNPSLPINDVKDSNHDNPTSSQAISATTSIPLSVDPGVVKSPVAVQKPVTSTLTAERQSYLEILRKLEPRPPSPRPDISHVNIAILDDMSADDSRGEEVVEVINGNFHHSTTMDAQQEYPPYSTSESEAAQSGSPDPSVLRLKGGAPQSTKRKKKSRPSSQSATEEVSSVEVSQMDIDTDHGLTSQVQETGESTEMSPDLEAERKSYLHMAKEITSLPSNNNEVLEEVGPGYRAVVERQKAKEAKNRMDMDTEPQDDDAIEFVPQTDISNLITKPMIEGIKDIKQTPHSEVQLSTLSDMFKAKETDQIGFTLQDALIGVELEAENMDDVELSLPDPVVSHDTRSRSSHRINSSIHPSRMALKDSESTSLNVKADTQNRKHLFFPLPVEEDDTLGLPKSVFENLRDQSSLTCWRTFKRTETISEIEEAYEAKKGDLTEQMRRKHKDSVKWSRKWGKKL